MRVNAAPHIKQATLKLSGIHTALLILSDDINISSTVACYPPEPNDWTNKIVWPFLCFQSPFNLVCNRVSFPITWSPNSVVFHTFYYFYGLLIFSLKLHMVWQCASLNFPLSLELQNQPDLMQECFKKDSEKIIMSLVYKYGPNISKMDEEMHGNRLYSVITLLKKMKWHLDTRKWWWTKKILF